MQKRNLFIASTMVAALVLPLVSNGQAGPAAGDGFSGRGKPESRRHSPPSQWLRQSRPGATT